MQRFSKNIRSVAPISAGLLVVAFAIGCGSQDMSSPPAAAQAPSSSPERVAQFSELPDWSGVWRLRGSSALLDRDDGEAFVPGVRDYPPYRPDWEEKYTIDLVRAENQGNPDFPNPLVDTHTVFCAAGMPHVMVGPWDYEFAITPGMVWIVVDKETRRIYTDSRDYPPDDEVWPTMLGWSIGHWEDQTLVIETKSVRSGIWVDLTPATLSPEAVFSERIRQVDANTLENQMSITDSVALTEPWTFTKYYVRSRAETWAAEPATCGHPEDRNPIVNGRLMTVLPDERE